MPPRPYARKSVRADSSFACEIAFRKLDASVEASGPHDFAVRAHSRALAGVQLVGEPVGYVGDAKGDVVALAVLEAAFLDREYFHRFVGGVDSIEQRGRHFSKATGTDNPLQEKAQRFRRAFRIVGLPLEPIIDAASYSIDMVVTDAASYGVDVEIFKLCAPILRKAPLDTEAGCDSWPP
jgi:hypothetical protein